MIITTAEICACLFALLRAYYTSKIKKLKVSIFCVCFQEQIEKIGHLACTFVPEFVKGLCPSMIDKVYKNVYNEVVVNGMTPKDICHEVKLC